MIRSSKEEQVRIKESGKFSKNRNQDYGGECWNNLDDSGRVDFQLWVTGHGLVGQMNLPSIKVVLVGNHGVVCMYLGY